MILGALDIGHTLYMQGTLQGTVQKAARDGSLESASGSTAATRDALDTVVRNQLQTLHRAATVTFDRRFYRSFSEAALARAETFTDTNADTRCNNGEAFEDRNNNGVRDLDGADSVNNAGARDNVVYTVTISYPRLFPLDRMVGGSGTVRLSAATVLSNQPYGDQGSYGSPTVGHCP
jgi:hypothetical protein